MLCNNEYRLTYTENIIKKFISNLDHHLMADLNLSSELTLFIHQKLVYLDTKFVVLSFYMIQ